MSQGQGKDGERPLWSAQAEAVLSGLVDWQAAHPRATLAEIEAAGEGRLADLRVRLLEQAVCTAAEQTARDPLPPCPQCGGARQSRGAHTRAVRVRGDRQVSLRRPSAVCATCGHGLFPPG